MTRSIRAAVVCGALAHAVAFTGAAGAQQNNRGQHAFRYDTFGDEQLWTDVLRMDEALAGLSPANALKAGLKVDVEALPPELVAALRAKQVDLTSPATTLTLLRLDAVVGVIGKVTGGGRLTSVGVTCALCHSTVDDSFDAGIGRRLDGWPNRDLNVGAILGLSPALGPALKAQFATWGPGRYDPRHHAFDGEAIVTLNPTTLPVLIPPAYGLQGVGFETYTGDGTISYWNAYVGVSQMGGQGNFSDPRIRLSIAQTPDRVGAKLRELLEYQLSLAAPAAPAGSFNVAAAGRGNTLFAGKAGCATCHIPPTFTDVSSGPDPNVPVLHDPTAIGTDPLYAARSATKKYRATPLRGAWQHPPYFHDGSAATLEAVVEHYNQRFGLNLTIEEKADLVQYLKSI